MTTILSRRSIAKKIIRRNIINKNTISRHTPQYHPNYQTFVYNFGDKNYKQISGNLEISNCLYASTQSLEYEEMNNKYIVCVGYIKNSIECDIQLGFSGSPNIDDSKLDQTAEIFNAFHRETNEELSGYMDDFNIIPIEHKIFSNGNISVVFTGSISNIIACLKNNMDQHEIAIKNKKVTGFIYGSEEECEKYVNDLSKLKNDKLNDNINRLVFIHIDIVRELAHKIEYNKINNIFEKIYYNFK